MSTRDDLVAAAAQLMDDGGLEAVTLREVGRRAGVSHNAPYKHFADKEALLAAVAARELNGRAAAIGKIIQDNHSPESTLRAAMRGYVAWALQFPVRFKLVYGFWSHGTEELGLAAKSARGLLLDAVVSGQQDGWLPAGDPERLTALIQALAHGAVDLALAGHLSAAGKGRAAPDDLVNDLFDHLHKAAG